MEKLWQQCEIVTNVHSVIILLNSFKFISPLSRLMLLTQPAGLPIHTKTDPLNPPSSLLYRQRGGKKAHRSCLEKAVWKGLKFAFNSLTEALCQPSTSCFSNVNNFPSVSAHRYRPPHPWGTQQRHPTEQQCPESKLEIKWRWCYVD